MSISTYTELQTAIATWLAGAGDTEITGNVADLVTLAEQRIFYGAEAPYESPPLRHRWLETSADITIDAQTEALPTGFLATRRFYLNTDPKVELDFLPPIDFWFRYTGSATGKPAAFTIEGDNFVFGRSPDATYTGKLLHYKKLDALSVTASNTLLTNAPGVYLYAALLEAAGLGVEAPDKVAYWHGLYRSAIGGLMRSDRLDRYSGAPLQIRGDTSNPPQFASGIR